MEKIYKSLTTYNKIEKCFSLKQFSLLVSHMSTHLKHFINIYMVLLFIELTGKNIS